MISCEKVTTYKHEINYVLYVRIVTEILIVATRETGADPVMLVHHACDAIKSEPIELIFFHVES